MFRILMIASTCLIVSCSSVTPPPVYHNPTPPEILMAPAVPLKALRDDGNPVTVEEVANTQAENYRTCRIQAERLTALQEWVEAIGQ